MSTRLRRRVRDRAANRCEYCGLPQECLPLAPFHVEHIIPKQHGGPTKLGNLAWACNHCNFSKGPNLAGLNKETGSVIPLFHPREQKWDPDRVKLRRQLMAEGVFPVHA